MGYYDNTMLQRLLVLIIPICAGLALGSQAPINATLARHVGPLRATLVSVMVSVMAMVLIVGINRGGGTLSAALTAPRWALVGGLLGVIGLLGSVISVPRLGTAATLTLMVVGQLTMAAMIDHFGWLGVTQRPLDTVRVLGLVLLAAGGTLVIQR